MNNSGYLCAEIGRMRSHYYRMNSCNNFKEPVHGNFCSNCGQPTRIPRMDVMSFLNGLLSFGMGTITSGVLIVSFGILVDLIITGCAKQETLITIEVQEQPDVDKLIYSVPHAGITFLGFTDTLTQSEAGKFALKLKKFTEPAFITIFSEDYQNRVKLLVEPGNSYHVLLSPEKKSLITGANERGQMLYATLPDPDPVYVDSELRKWLYGNDTLPYFSVQQQINDLKLADLTKFKELLDNREITKSFFDLAQKDRDCYYTALEARLLIIKSYESYRLRYNKDEGDLPGYLEKIYALYPVSDESLYISSYWAGYSNFFVQEYKQFIHGDLDIEKLRELRNNGTYHTHILHEAKKYLNGKALEFFRARYLWMESYEGTYKGDFEKELGTLFEQFENDYPKSAYSKYIRPYIDKIVSFHESIGKPFEQGKVIADYETFNTLDEAIRPLRGKKIYVDVWATWCGPCKKEFEHNDVLNQILLEKDIQLLYISIDGDNKDEQWKNEIRFYRLAGAHIRANDALKLELMVLFSGNPENASISIPWYLLIDEEGNIIEKHAKSPSQQVMSGGRRN